MRFCSQKGIESDFMRPGFYFGIDAQFWLNPEARYSLMMLEQKRRHIQRQVHPLSKAV